MQRYQFSPLVLEQHIAVIGKTGAGKTNTGKLLIEQVAGSGSRVCILDPIKSDWWGLTLSESGKYRSNFPFYILGGPKGHIDLDPQAGKAIAEVVADSSLKLSILDMADFPPGGQANFFVDFATNLLKKMRGVLYLVIEEAHLFAPKERSGIGKENMAVHWAKTLATAGRSKGIRLVVLTQRTQALHNAVLGSCDTIIAHRMTAPADREPISKWLRANTEKDKWLAVEGSLGSLSKGEAWICSGEAKLFERVKFPKITTYDNTATPEEGGDNASIEVPQVNLDALRTLVKSSVEEIKANDPVELKKKIAELEKKLYEAVADSTAEVLAHDEKQRLFEQGRESERHLISVELEKAFIAGRDQTANRLKELLSDETKYHLPRLREAVSLLNANFERVETVIEEICDFDNSRIQPPQQLTSKMTPPEGSGLPIPKPVTRQLTVHPSSAMPEMSGARRMLLAVYQSKKPLTKLQICIRAFMTFKSGTVDTYISAMKKSGQIELQNGGYVITRIGTNELGSNVINEPLLPRGAGRVAHWCQQVGGGASRMLNFLFENYLRYVPKDELATGVGMARSGTFDTYLSKLRSLNLVVATKAGVMISPEVWSD